MNYENRSNAPPYSGSSRRGDRHPHSDRSQPRNYGRERSPYQPRGGVNRLVELEVGIIKC